MIAVVFPGQGSQSVGMGLDLQDEALSAGILQQANDALGYDLTKIMFEGPEDELKLTRNTQPALLAHSIAIWALIKDRLKPAFFAGHSLGEYTALVAAGGIDFVDAVKAVHNRGIFMQEAVPAGVGGMAAVLGAADSLVEETCKEVSTADSFVEPANYNCDGQLVVAGHVRAIESFIPAMKAKGAKRVVMLPVSAPFHSSLMLPAQIKMAEYLNSVNIKKLAIPVINNVDVAVEEEAAEVRDALIRQMSGAVKWTQLVKKLSAAGITRVIEVGSGSVLSGLIKKIDKNIECTNINKLEDINKI